MFLFQFSYDAPHSVNCCGLASTLQLSSRLTDLTHFWQILLLTYIMYIHICTHTYLHLYIYIHTDKKNCTHLSFATLWFGRFLTICFVFRCRVRKYAEIHTRVYIHTDVLVCVYLYKYPNCMRLPKEFTLHIVIAKSFTHFANAQLCYTLQSSARFSRSAPGLTIL